MDRPPLIVSWISALIVLGIVVYGWHAGKPLTADVIVVLGAFWSWAVRTTLWSSRQLKEHREAIRQIAADTGHEETQVRRLYDRHGNLIETKAEAQRTRKSLPPGDPR